MRQYHFHEIANKRWCPDVFRNLITDILQFTVMRFRIYESVIPFIKEIMRYMKTTRIIDLCSGSSGPWSQMLAQLQRSEKFVSVTLTDKYPNVQAFEKIKARSGGKIQYIAEEVNATNVPAHLKGVRTVFSGFHHFEPDEARKILQNTVSSRSAIGVFDYTEKSLDKIACAFFLPLFVFLTTAFIKPLTLKRIFWVNIIPIIPLLLTYDAVISSLTTYSVKELKELVKGIDSEGYVWEIGQVPSNLRSVRVTYLIGFPKDLQYA